MGLGQAGSMLCLSGFAGCRICQSLCFFSLGHVKVQVIGGAACTQSLSPEKNTGGKSQIKCAASSGAALRCRVGCLVNLVGGQVDFARILQATLAR